MNIDSIHRKLQKIKLLALDFDGILTDGYVYTFEDGREAVRCSRRDGLGIELLKKAGVMVVIVSKEKNSVVKARAEKLNVPCWQGVETGDKKLAILKSIAKECELSDEEVAYMGDDINDLEAVKYAGVSVTVADGHQRLKEVTHYVTEAQGGYHAVREIAEVILKAKTL